MSVVKASGDDFISKEWVLSRRSDTSTLTSAAVSNATLFTFRHPYKLDPWPVGQFADGVCREAFATLIAKMQPFTIDSSRTNMQYRYEALGDARRSTTSLLQKIPPVLRPRFTWQYATCTAIVAYVVYCFIFNLPFFAHPLPQYTGPYDVGAIDIEYPLEKSRIINDAKFKATGEHAFEVETVLFTVYFPAQKNSKSKKARHYWIPPPLSVTAAGYAKLAKISNAFTDTIFTAAVGMLVGSIRIPAKVDVPLADHIDPPVQLEDRAKERQGLPVLVFTHGMASRRSDYSQWVGELASRGYIVAAIEHRDGSCPGSIVTSSDGSTKRRMYFAPSEVEGGISMPDFKTIQVSYRQAEIEETVKVLRAINQGQGSKIHKLNARKEGSDLDSWAGKLNTDTMILAGHSYGATGALRALKPGPASSLPFKGAIILDPGKGSGSLNDDISVPILVIHSNSWSSSRSIFEGRPHFDVVRDLVEKNAQRGHASWFMTSLGTSHPSVTDAPLLEPLLLSWTTGAHIDVHEGVRQYVHVSEDFLWFLGTGEKRNLLKEKANYPQYEEKFGWGKYQGQGDGWKRFWQVHVAP